MKKVHILMIAFLFITLNSCRIKKTETTSKETELNSSSLSIDKGKESDNTNTEINKEVFMSTDGLTKTKKITVTPFDNSKPAEFTNKYGEKVNVNNARYTEEEEEKSVKNSKKENTNTIIATDIKKENTSESKVDIKLDEKNNKKIKEAKSLFGSWWLILIPMTLALACYVFYRIYLK